MQENGYCGFPDGAPAPDRQYNGSAYRTQHPPMHYIPMALETKDSWIYASKRHYTSSRCIHPGNTALSSLASLPVIGTIGADVHQKNVADKPVDNAIDSSIFNIPNLNLDFKGINDIKTEPPPGTVTALLT